MGQSEVSREEQEVAKRSGNVWAPKKMICSEEPILCRLDMSGNLILY